MKYQVITGYSITDLEEKVNVCLKKGWKPIGGVEVVKYDDSIVFMQAVIKSDEIFC
jgi:hypothetical protein